MAGHAPPDRSEWESPDDWLEDGEVVVASGRELIVVETPGHTRGHVVFHDLVGRLLFAGDHVLPTITPSIGFEPLLSPDPLGEFLGSLARVRERPDALLLPAHGPVAPSVHARIDELVDHHGRRLEEIEAAVAGGAETPPSRSPAAFGGLDGSVGSTNSISSTRCSPSPRPVLTWPCSSPNGASPGCSTATSTATT